MVTLFLFVRSSLCYNIMDCSLIRLKQREIRMERVFKASLEEMDNANIFLEEMMEQSGLSMKAQMDVSVAFEEMFVNVVSYAYIDAPGDVKVKIEIKQGRFEVTLVDSGIKYNPLEKEDPDITLSAEERAIGGLGIFMVKKMMDEVNYEYVDGHNSFTFVKYF